MNKSHNFYIYRKPALKILLNKCQNTLILYFIAMWA